MHIANKLSLREELEQCFNDRQIDQISMLLVNYDGDDLDHQYQRAFRLSLESGNIHFFTKLYSSRKSGHRILPDKKLLLQAVAETIIFYKINSRKEMGFRLVDPTFIKVLFEMLVSEQLVSEFVMLYQDLQNINAVDMQIKPDDQTLFMAVQICEQHMKYFPDGEDRVRFQKARETIKSVFQI